MDDRQRSALAAFHRIQFQLDQHAHLLGNLRESEPRKELDWLVVKLDTAATYHQEVWIRAQGETQLKYALRESLFIDHMQPIVSLIAMNRSELMEISTLAMPPAHTRDCQLGTIAGVMAQCASKYRDTFVRGGLPADFVEQIRAAADEFTALCTARDHSRLEWRGLTRSIDYDIRRAWVVYGALRALARKALRKHPELLAEFHHAKLHRPRPALPAAPSRRALPAGAPADAGVSTAVVPEAAEHHARRPVISAIARIVGFGRPEA
jgi:hypothetical protein